MHLFTQHILCIEFYQYTRKNQHARATAFRGSVWVVAADARQHQWPTPLVWLFWGVNKQHWVASMSRPWEHMKLFSVGPKDSKVNKWGATSLLGKFANSDLHTQLLSSYLSHCPNSVWRVPGTSLLQDKEESSVEKWWPLSQGTRASGAHSIALSHRGKGLKPVRNKDQIMSKYIATSWAVCGHIRSWPRAIYQKGSWRQWEPTQHFNWLSSPWLSFCVSINCQQEGYRRFKWHCYDFICKGCTGSSLLPHFFKHLCPYLHRGLDAKK